MVRWQQIDLRDEHLELVTNTYRPDLYRSALTPLQLELPSEDSKVEGKATASNASIGTLALQPHGFFDGKIFDPNDLRGYLAPL
jgi:two-component system, oxyanion-binding sensor